MTDIKSKLPIYCQPQTVNVLVAKTIQTESGEFESLPFRKQKTDCETVTKQNNKISGSSLPGTSNAPMARDLRKAYVYNALGNTSKDWYVFYWDVNPKTQKKFRTRLSARINYEKDPAQRSALIEKLRMQVQRMLDLGVTDSRKMVYPERTNDLSIVHYLKLVQTEKLKFQTKYSAKTTRSHFKYFIQFLREKNLHNLPPQSIKQSAIAEFVNWNLDKGKSNRTVNNILIDVNSFFNYLPNRFENYNEKNPCKAIKKLPTRSEKHVTFTQQQARDISEYLKLNNPTLHLFCQFITYTFMRPSEICKIKIGQIDKQGWTITRTAENEKTGKRKVQRIQNIFKPSLTSLEINNLPPNFYLFGNTKKPGNKNMCYEHFRKEFKKVKDHFGFTDKHTMYGLKHTFICQLKKNGATDEQLMAVTGHETKDALYKYLRGIGAMEVKDLSELYDFQF